MNSKFLFSICLILVAIIGFGCVSAADAHNSTITETSSVTVEQQQTVDMIQNQNEIINTEKATKEDVEASNIKVICSPNNKIKQDINTTTQTNDTNNKTSTNNTKPKLDIRGPKINNTPLDIKGPNMPYKIIKKSKTFEYNGKKLFLAQIDTGKERKTVCFQLNSAGSGYVQKTGNDAVKILKKKGIIDKVAYGFSWITIKIGKWFNDDFDHMSSAMEEYLIKTLAWGPDQSKWLW